MSTLLLCYYCCCVRFVKLRKNEHNVESYLHCLTFPNVSKWDELWSFLDVDGGWGISGGGGTGTLPLATNHGAWRRSRREGVLRQEGGGVQYPGLTLSFPSISGAWWENNGFCSLLTSCFTLFSVFLVLPSDCYIYLMCVSSSFTSHVLGVRPGYGKFLS